MNKKKLQIFLPVILSMLVVAGIYASFKLNNTDTKRSFFYLKKPDMIDEVMELIKYKYVDEVDLGKISDTSLKNVLSKLDPHSVWIPAAELEDINDEIEGNFYGVGIEFDMINDTLNVITVMKDGPASKAGILTGDKILIAGGKPLTGKNISDDSVRKIIRGDRGTKMNMSILRGIKMMKISVERDLVPVSSIDASYMINKECGYIRINKFSSQTHREFMFALEDLKNRGMKKMILDLRDNGGGVLDEAVEIADEFIDGDKLITYTEGRHMPKKEYRCKRQGQFETGSLVVLSNESSASASEVLMGALQDWDRAVIVGKTSFGKGLVQEQYDLSDNSALRLTVARYYTPSGRCIQRSYSSGDEAYFKEIHDRINGQVKKQKTDSSRFFKTASGKKVYAGGGISPDKEVLEDSVILNYKNRINTMLSGFDIRKFAFRYCMSNAELKTKYPDSNDFVKSFQLSDKDWMMFLRENQSDSLDFSTLKPAEINYLKNQIKANIAKISWGESAFYNCQNLNDPYLTEALQALKP